MTRDEFIEAWGFDEEHTRRKCLIEDIDALIAAAREEQREACAVEFDCLDLPGYAQMLRERDLTATPLADEIKRLDAYKEELMTRVEHHCARADAAQNRIRELEAEVASLEFVNRQNIEVADGEYLRVVRERDRITTDVLTALSAAGIATPVEGYAKATWAIEGDIQRLAKERDEARAEVSRLETALVRQARLHAGLEQA